MSRGWYPPSRPRSVDGGMRARSARGAIGQTWWSERFIAVLEQIGLGNRLQRGRSYARRGQVVSFDLDAGSVTAQVQGSRARPYRVRIGIRAYGKGEWASIEDALAGDAWYTANLLAGQMPEEIEDLFSDMGTTLFPTTATDLSMDCSCPDREVPCKHVAAVFYLLAEAFDEDPFLILQWRGRERDDLLTNISTVRSSGPPAADRVGWTGRSLTECIDSYFDVQGEMPATSPALSPSTALLDQLPPVDVTVRGKPLPEILRPAYQAVGEPRWDDDS